MHPGEPGIRSPACGVAAGASLVLGGVPPPRGGKEEAEGTLGLPRAQLLCSLFFLLPPALPQLCSPVSLTHVPSGPVMHGAEKMGLTRVYDPSLSPDAGDFEPWAQSYPSRERPLLSGASLLLGQLHPAGRGSQICPLAGRSRCRFRGPNTCHSIQGNKTYCAGLAVTLS